jgi:hypothetical protein
VWVALLNPMILAGNRDPEFGQARPLQMGSAMAKVKRKRSIFPTLP